jgi:hypothetical protein
MAASSDLEQEDRPEMIDPRIPRDSAANIGQLE